MRVVRFGGAPRPFLTRPGGRLAGRAAGLVVPASTADKTNQYIVAHCAKFGKMGRPKVFWAKFPDRILRQPAHKNSASVPVPMRCSGARSPMPKEEKEERR